MKHSDLSRSHAAQLSALGLIAALTIAAMAFASAGAAAPAGTTDLSIAKTDSPDPVRVGTPLTYAIVVDNRGPLAATGVKVTDTLPKGADLVAATSSAGPCARKGGKVTCDLGSVGYGGVNYAPATVSIVVIPRQPGSITNTASVRGSQKDPVRGNDAATATTRVLPNATCRGVTATVIGTPGDDVLTGSGGSDVIVAFAGNDTIRSGAGRDLVCAGAGNDLTVSGSAADRVLAGSGSDRLLGRGGPDALKAGSGNDVLKGGAGADRLRGGAGLDRCRGGAGADSVRGCER